MVHRGSIGVLALVIVGGMAGCRTPLIGGESALCGDPGKLAFHYATFKTPREPEAGTQAVFTTDRRVRLGDPVGVSGEDLSDVRLVGLGRSPNVTLSGGAVNSERGGARDTIRTGGEAEQASDTAPWRADVLMSLGAARRLREVVEEISGSYQVMAFVVGDEVFSASVDLSVGPGVARIEFGGTRSRSRALTFFRENLGCGSPEAS